MPIMENNCSKSGLGTWKAQIKWIANYQGELTSKSAETAWVSLPWKQIELQVFKAQKRIYRASLRGDIKLVRKLQRMMVKSYCAKLLAVRRISQDNIGSAT